MVAMSRTAVLHLVRLGRGWPCRHARHVEVSGLGWVGLGAGHVGVSLLVLTRLLVSCHLCCATCILFSFGIGLITEPGRQNLAKVFSFAEESEAARAATI